MLIYAASVSLVPTSDGINSFQNVSTGTITEFTYPMLTDAQITYASYPLINNTNVTASYINTAGSTTVDVFVSWNVTLPYYDSINSIYLTARAAPVTVLTGGLQIVLWNYSSPSWNLTNWTTTGGVATNRTLNYNLSTAGRISNFVNGRSMKFMVRTNGTTATDIAVDYMEVNVSYNPDVTLPTVSIVYPVTNNTNSSNTILDINYTRSDANGLYNCWYSNDSYKTNVSLGTTCDNVTTVTWEEGNHNIRIYANDTSSNVAFAQISFTIDDTVPAIYITSPLNNSNSSDNLLEINYTRSDAGSGLYNCWYTNDTYKPNASLSAACTNITTVTWSDGLHNLTIWANDSANNYNFSTVSFTIDTISPYLNITLPINNTISTNTGQDINYTRSDDGSGLYTCWYSNDTYLANTSLGTTCENITDVTWIEGNHNVTVWVNDSANNINRTTISFNISAVANSCIYTSGNWDINCADDCTISSNVVGSDATKYNVTFSGVGEVYLNANISNFLYYYLYGNTGCNVTCQRGNCIQN